MFFVDWEGWEQLYRHRCKSCGEVVESPFPWGEGYPPTCPNGCRHSDQRPKKDKDQE